MKKATNTALRDGVGCILPGSTIGVMGSGQLGRMMAIEAKKLGYRVKTYSPDADTARVSASSSREGVSTGEWLPVCTVSAGGYGGGFRTRFGGIGTTCSVEDGGFWLRREGAGEDHRWG